MLSKSNLIIKVEHIMWEVLDQIKSLLKKVIWICFKEVFKYFSLGN